MTAVEPLNRPDVNLQEQLIRRAWEDEPFAQLLSTNPRAAIAEETGIELPSDVDILVHQEDETTVHLVVPAQRTGPAEPIPSPQLQPVTFFTNGNFGACEVGRCLKFQQKDRAQ